MEENKNLKIRPIKNAPEITSVEILPGRDVRLTWCDAVGAEKYVIIRYSTIEGERVREKLETLTAEFNTYRDTTINEDGSFEYKVIAKKKIGPKQYASKSSMAAIAEIISVEPPELKHIKGESRKITISWDRDETVYGYVVLRRFAFMKKAMPIKVLKRGETEYSDSKFAKGQLMYYSIQSIISSGDGFAYSKPSNELCSVILPQPVVVEKKKRLGKKIDITVRLCAGADGYVLFRRCSPEDEREEVMRTAGIDKFTVTDAEKKPAKELYYSVSCFRQSSEGIEFIGPESNLIHVRF